MNGAQGADSLVARCRDEVPCTGGQRPANASFAGEGALASVGPCRGRAAPGGVSVCVLCKRRWSVCVLCIHIIYYMYIQYQTQRYVEWMHARCRQLEVYCPRANVYGVSHIGGLMSTATTHAVQAAVVRFELLEGGSGPFGAGGRGE